MNLLVTVVLVFLLAHVECDAKVLRRGSDLHGGPSRRQDSKSLVPQCHYCKKPINIDSRQGFIRLEYILHIINEAKNGLKKIFDTDYTSKEKLRYAIDEIVEQLDEEVSNVVGTMYTDMKIDNIESCPPFKTLFREFKTDFDLTLQTLTNNWEKLIENSDRDTRFAVLAQSLAYDVPVCLFLIKELMINCIDLFLPEDCKNLILIIHNFLDPEGNLSIAIANTLSSSGSESTELAANVLASIIPKQTEGGRDTLDVLKMLLKLICGGARIFYPYYKNSPNIRMLLDPNCPPEEDKPGFMPVVKAIVCGIASEVERDILPPEIQDLCSTS